MGFLITRNKVENLAEHLGKGLRYLGQAMTCVDEMQRESEMGERSYGGRYGNRYGMREDERWREEEEMNERRGVPGSGRYGRY